MNKRHALLIGGAAVVGVLAVRSIRNRKVAGASQDLHEYGSVSYPTSRAPVIVLPDAVSRALPDTVTSLWNSPNAGLEPMTYDLSQYPNLQSWLPFGGQNLLPQPGSLSPSNVPVRSVNGWLSLGQGKMITEYDPVHASAGNVALSGLGTPHLVTTADGDRLYDPATGNYVKVA